MTLTRTRYILTKEEIKMLMNAFKINTPEKALEIYAFQEFDLRHNASISLGKVGKTYFEIIEMP